MEAYNLVMREHNLSPEEDTAYYRFLLKLSLDNGKDWWQKYQNIKRIHEMKKASHQFCRSHILLRFWNKWKDSVRVLTSKRLEESLLEDTEADFQRANSNMNYRQAARDHSFTGSFYIDQEGNGSDEGGGYIKPLGLSELIDSLSTPKHFPAARSKSSLITGNPSQKVRTEEIPRNKEDNYDRLSLYTNQIIQPMTPTLSPLPTNATDANSSMVLTPYMSYLKEKNKRKVSRINEDSFYTSSLLIPETPKLQRVDINKVTWEEAVTYWHKKLLRKHFQTWRR
jgi:hypothetical protein